MNIKNNKLIKHIGENLCLISTIAIDILLQYINGIMRTSLDLCVYKCIQERELCMRTTN